MTLKKEIESFENDLNLIRKKADVWINPAKYLNKQGILFNSEMEFSQLSEDSLSLSHVLLHKWNLEKEGFFDKPTIRKLHTTCVKEMETRGTKHLSFDKLDEIIR